MPQINRCQPSGHKSFVYPNGKLEDDKESALFATSVEKGGRRMVSIMTADVSKRYKKRAEGESLRCRIDSDIHVADRISAVVSRVFTHDTWDTSMRSSPHASYRFACYHAVFSVMISNFFPL